MAKYKVVHYINQFYAGMGGEDTASVGISVRDGAVGPGLALKANLGADYEIVKTIICGDNTIEDCGNSSADSRTRKRSRRRSVPCGPWL